MKETYHERLSSMLVLFPTGRCSNNLSFLYFYVGCWRAGENKCQIGFIFVVKIALREIYHCIYCYSL